MPKETQHFTITKIRWLMFKEIIAMYSQNHTKPINTFCGVKEELLIVQARGT
jgi:hypothetical protein